MKDIRIFQPPSKKTDQQIDITTLTVSCVGLNVSIFKQLHTQCKLTHLHVRRIMEPRLKRRRFLSVDNFIKTKAAFVLPSCGGMMLSESCPLGSACRFRRLMLSSHATQTGRFSRSSQMKPTCATVLEQQSGAQRSGMASEPGLDD